MLIRLMLPRASNVYTRQQAFVITGGILWVLTNCKEVRQTIGPTPARNVGLGSARRSGSAAALYGTVTLTDVLRILPASSVAVAVIVEAPDKFLLPLPRPFPLPA